MVANNLKLIHIHNLKYECPYDNSTADLAGSVPEIIAWSCMHGG